MEYRRLGRAGVRVSEIGLGSWLTFGGGIEEKQARACVKRALDSGINFFDTADVYNRGEAEEALARMLKGVRRQELVLATKCFWPMSDDPNDRGLSRKHIFESVHNSLKRLRTDYLDLMQCHRYDPQVEMDEVVRAMDDLVRQGKTLYWGVSEWPAEKIREACELCRRSGAALPVSEQPEYSIAARRVETNGVQAACAELGVGMVVWSPLKQGVLSGKYSGGKLPKQSRGASRKMNGYWGKLHENKALLEKVDALRPIAERHKITLSQLAIAWLLGRPAVSSVIIGASRPSQVDENVGAVEARLTAEDLAEIDRLFPAGEHP
ncbi:MAG: aldo/keto reductase family protein [Planctomycetia bacterium]|nr:MAG: aldo/keto reductase family protein [Planctomycetia bacterium]